MEFANPFSAPGSWYKGNLHTHTSASDGALDPAECVRRYQAADYDFLALTDHGVVTPLPPVEGSDFLLLYGVEMAGDRTDLDEHFHIVGFGLTGEEPAPERPTVAEAIKWSQDHGGDAFIAHPSWSGLVIQDMMKDTGHLGFEIFNSGCHFEQGKGYSLAHWDDVLGRDRRAWGFAVDDSHHGQRARHPVDTAKAWVMVKAPTLTREAILGAIREGLFYSSFGPTIHNLEVTDGVVTITTSPCTQINFIAQRWCGAKNWAMTTPAITTASYQLTGREQYLRLECRDIEGRWAWSNPMYFREPK